tara:strand:- start:69654 stop:70769 length:1116 start_codon:yes stop_codon:yes gene_type:complete
MLFHSPYGDFSLLRYPARKQEPLLAWCAADSLLLEAAHERNADPQHSLVVNDDHGALAVAMQPAASWTDSALSAQALLNNLSANHRNAVPVAWSTERPPVQALQTVLFRIPKQLAFFRYQLALLSQILPAGATVLAAGMDKHLSPHSAALLEQYIGPVERHRGQRKARLFSAIADVTAATELPADDSYFCPALDARLHSLPNVFSRDKFDAGSDYLIAGLSDLPPVTRAIDLACGNGVLGLWLLHTQKAAHVTFCDESAMAMASARDNAQRLFPDTAAQHHFHHGDGLQRLECEPVERILCNPPFHMQHTVDDFAGRHLLAQCAGKLQPGGRLFVVANRHLDYRPTLRRDFRRVERLAQNRQFAIWVAHKA